MSVIISLSHNEVDMYTDPSKKGKKFRDTVRLNLKHKAMIYCSEVGVVATSCEIVDEDGDRIDAFLYTDYNDATKQQ